MKRVLFTAMVLAAFGLLLAWGSAQAAPYLVTNAQEGVQGYEITGITTPGLIAAQTDGSLRYDLSSVAIGSYTLSLKACNVWGCSSASPFQFTKTLPTPPVNARIVAE